MSDKWATWLWYFNISFVNLFPFHCVTQPRGWKLYSFLKFKFLLVLFLYYSLTTRNNTEKYLCARWIMLSTARATKWPPACHWCECLWPNSQKHTSWGWSKDPTSFSESCAHCLAPWSPCESEEEPGKRYASNDIIQHDQYGSGSVTACRGISTEGCTDLCRQQHQLLLGIGSYLMAGRTHCQTLL